MFESLIQPPQPPDGMLHVTNFPDDKMVVIENRDPHRTIVLHLSDLDSRFGCGLSNGPHETVHIAPGQKFIASTQPQPRL